MKNQLHFGDNLEVLRSGAVRPESVDLIYLDPPFNSNATYSMLFREPEGARSQAQIEAFEDTWSWGQEAEEAYDDVLMGENQRLSKLVHALRDTLGENSMMAYLAMMAVRLVELHRVLKKTGSMYLHCDPTASHYLKLVLDAVFGTENYRAEIIWKRYGAHSNSGGYGRVHDTIFFYSKSAKFTFNKQHEPYGEDYVRERFRFTDPDGRRWAEQNLANPAKRPNLTYAFAAKNGVTYKPPPNGWKYTRERMQELDDQNRLHYPAKGDGRLRLKNYQDERLGVPVQDIWTDISVIGGTSPERLGYPTQKPVALLERIIAASSNEGDVVLDPFCGCGTAIHASQRMNRKWIGIDITHLAISLIESRIVSAFPDVDYDLFGTPKDLAGAKQLAFRNKHQFEWWAISLVKAQPANDRKKGADGGIDGLMWLRVGYRERAKVVVSVKGGFSVSVPMIRDLVGVIDREQAAIGLFVTLAEPTGPMKAEAAKAGFYTVEGERYPRVQILTVEQLLEGKKPDLPLIDHAALRPIAQVDQGRTEQPRLL